jgi:hypothetical protein
LDITEFAKSAGRLVSRDIGSVATGFTKELTINLLVVLDLTISLALII